MFRLNSFINIDKVKVLTRFFSPKQKHDGYQPGFDTIDYFLIINNCHESNRSQVQRLFLFTTLDARSFKYFIFLVSFFNRFERSGTTKLRSILATRNIISLVNSITYLYHRGISQLLKRTKKRLLIFRFISRLHFKPNLSRLRDKLL